MTAFVLMSRDDFDMVEAGAMSVEGVKRKSGVVEIDQSGDVVLNSIGGWRYYKAGRTHFGLIVIAALGPASDYNQEAERLASRLRHPASTAFSSQAGLASFRFAQAGVPGVEKTH